MADVESNEVAPVIAEKEVVTSSVKESPVKETNGKSAPVGDEVKEKNGSEDNGVAGKEEAVKENGDGPKEEEVKENGDSIDDVCAIKRKSCGAEAEVTSPEKKAKLAEKEEVSPDADESNDAEAVEA